MSQVPSNAGSWNTLNVKLSQPILDTLMSLGFTEMTPVQSATIPLFMQNKDVVVEAVTGSGKTLAFVVPILEKLICRKVPFQKNEIGALIITPTRELAQQISSVFSIFLKNTSIPLKHSLFIGGGGSSAIKEDLTSFLEAGPDIIIGTPGRLEDLLVGRNGVKSPINTKELEVLVLDEADRLLDMGFMQSLTKIIAHLPRQRRTGLFSATMTDALSEIVRAGLRNPVRIVVKVEDLISKDEQRTPSTLQISYIVCEPHQKLSQLLRLLKAETLAKKFIIYFSTCACVDYFYKIFAKLPQFKQFSVYSLHGQMDPKRRSATYNSFASLPPTSPALLLCTDVAARGLDVPDVDFVIQMDAPQDPKVFSHRCGRTARAGKDGKAVLFIGKGREEVYIGVHYFYCSIATENNESNNDKLITIDFLKIRKIPIQQQSYFLADGKPYVIQDETVKGDDDKNIDDSEMIPKQDDDNEMFLNQIRDLVLTDRDYHEKGIKAFVSYIRSYSKHDASYIFRLKDLDFGKVAKGYGLLRMPKMPELKDRKIEFEEIKINMDEYKFLDKAREKKRLKKLAESREKTITTGTNDGKRNRKNNMPWSEKQMAKERKIKRKLKKERKREYLKKQKMDEVKSGNNNSSGQIDNSEDDELEMEAEWEELQREERLAKKVRRGQMNEDEFEKEVGNMSEIN
ncbi:6557_t:CDS:10 [Ambispora leptoticha]|uniref:ATP-dependent RNA helicase n=1 Tax=Ambispora leptoticha TaxID=144679 RepID=A0A9N9F0V3_9GLOM|nr:6557_t:CDS:10 [Ambispora leptoticha]